MFDGLSAAASYTFYVRTKATGEHFASEVTILSVYTAATPPAPGTGYVIDYTEETLSALEDYFVSEDGEIWVESLDVIPGATYYVRKAPQADVPVGHRRGFIHPEFFIFFVFSSALLVEIG